LTKKNPLPSFQGEEYEVVDDSQEHWWKVRDKFGYFLFNKTKTNNKSNSTVNLLFCCFTNRSGIGYIPSNYVKEKELIGLQKYE